MEKERVVSNIDWTRKWKEISNKIVEWAIDKVNAGFPYFCYTRGLGRLCDDERASEPPGLNSFDHRTEGSGTVLTQGRQQPSVRPV